MNVEDHKVLFAAMMDFAWLLGYAKGSDIIDDHQYVKLALNLDKATNILARGPKDAT